MKVIHIAEKKALAKENVHREDRSIEWRGKGIRRRHGLPGGCAAAVAAAAVFVTRSIAN